MDQSTRNQRDVRNNRLREKNSNGIPATGKRIELKRYEK